MTRKSTLTVTAAAVSLAFGLAACGDTQDGEPTMGSEAAETGAPEETGSPGEDTQESAGETFGPECATLPEEGEGSVDAMAEQPVGTAISENPMLSTLSEMLGQAELVDTLDSEEDITVFAPTDDAFDQMPEEELNTLQEDQQQLTEVLNYHVVEGMQEPTDLEEGTFTSLQGEDVTTQGSGEEFTVNEEAQVVCGNVQTSNATVYMIDGVLMPAE